MIRAVLVAVLCGMLLGGGEIAFLTYPVMREQAVEIRNMSSDVHAMRQQFDLGMKMVGDGVKEADARPAIAPVVNKAGKPVRKKLKYWSREGHTSSRAQLRTRG